MNSTLKNVGKRLYDVYFAIGAVAMALLATLVAFTVIARYFFAHSWKELAEFITTLFAVTTFWGMGICLLRNDHVIIDIVYDRIKPSVKRQDNIICIHEAEISARSILHSMFPCQEHL